MTTFPGQWICRGGDRPHPVDLNLLATLPDFGSNSVAIESGRDCDTVYRHLWFDVNDWGASGDRWSETHNWTPLGPDEVEKLRMDSAYQPRAEAAHRWEGPWQRS